MHYQVDSACLGSWLNPHVLHKQVLIRNMCTAVHNLCSDLSQDIPLRISFSHVAGVKNISDYNSKLVPNQDPILLINSPEWRHRNPEFTNSDFPGQQNIFLQFKGGKMSFYKQPVIVKCSCLGQLCVTSPTLRQCQGCIPADMTPTHVNNVLISKSTDTSLNDLFVPSPGDSRSPVCETDEEVSPPSAPKDYEPGSPEPNWIQSE